MNSQAQATLTLCGKLLNARILSPKGCYACVRALKSKRACSDPKTWELVDDLVAQIQALDYTEDPSALQSYSIAAQLFIKHGIRASLSDWFVGDSPEESPTDAERQSAALNLLKVFCRGAARRLKAAQDNQSKEEWMQIRHDAQLVHQHLFSSLCSPLQCTLMTFEALLSVGKYAFASYLLGDDVQFDELALAVAQENLDAAVTLEDESFDHAQRCLTTLGRRKRGLAAVERERNLHSALLLLRDSFRLVDVAPVQLRALRGNQRFKYICRLAPKSFLTQNPTGELVELCQLLDGDPNFARLLIALALLDEAANVDEPDGATDSAVELFNHLAAEQYAAASRLGMRLLDFEHYVDRAKILAFCLTHIPPTTPTFVSALDLWRTHTLSRDATMLSGATKLGREDLQTSVVGTDSTTPMTTTQHSTSLLESSEASTADCCATTEDEHQHQQFDAQSFPALLQRAPTMHAEELRRAIVGLTSSATPLYFHAARLLASSRQNRLPRQLRSSMPACFAQLRAFQDGSL